MINRKTLELHNYLLLTRFRHHIWGWICHVSSSGAAVDSLDGETVDDNYYTYSKSKSSGELQVIRNVRVGR